MSKETFYFSHDYNARSDEKIRALIRKHGMQGYGIYWSIIEDLYNNTNVLRCDYDSIAYELRTNYDVIKSVIDDFDLFVFEGETFGSLSVQNRLEKRKNKSEKARDSVMNRWKNKESNTNVLRAEYERNTIKESKVKESKVKESKLIPPTILEIENYFTENGFDKTLAKKAFNYYSVANWSDSSGKKIKNWKQKMQGVWFKDENKEKKPYATKKESVNGMEYREKQEGNLF